MKLPIDNKMYGFGEQRNDNRWLMVALLAFALLWLGHSRAGVQIASSNPLEYVAPFSYTHMTLPTILRVCK